MYIDYPLQSIFLELRKSMRISMPLVFSQLIYALSGIVITIMVSHLGRDELATNALVWAIYITLVLFFVGILNAVCILVAQSYGASDNNSIRIAVIQGIILAFIFTIPMMGVIWLTPTILYWTGQNQIIIKLAVPYCHSLALGMLPLNLLFVMEQFLIGIGMTRLVLFFSMLKVPLEVLLVYILLWGKYSLPKLGLVGVGYALALSATIITFCIVCYIYFKKECRPYRIFSFSYEINIKYLNKLLRLGLPLGGMCCIELALFATATFMMGYFGNDALAAHQFSYQCVVFTLTIIFGILQATTVRVGYEVGRNDRKSLKLSTYVNLSIGLCFTLVIASLYVFFPKNIIALGFDTHVVKNQLLVKNILSFLSLAAILQIVEGMRLITIGALRGLNDTKMVMYISVVAFWLVALPSAYLLAFKLNLYGIGIWLGLVIGIMCGLVISFVRFRYLVESVDLGRLITKL